MFPDCPYNLWHTKHISNELPQKLFVRAFWPGCISQFYKSGYITCERLRKIIMHIAPPKNTPALLTSTGYGSSGSSAGTNILEEFDFVKSLNNDEFTFLHDPDGMADLEDSLREGHRLKTGFAIKRFLKLSTKLMRLRHYKTAFNGEFEHFAAEFIDSITKCKWDGWWQDIFDTEELSIIDKFRIEFSRAAYEILTKSHTYSLYEPDTWQPQYKPRTKVYYSNFAHDYDETFFLEQARNFTAKLLRAENKDDKYKYILLDQAVPPISVSKYARYWNNLKVLIIDRDPRDLYVVNKATYGEGYIASDTVDQFIAWYASTRRMRDNEDKAQGYFLFLPFEGLIYNYDASLKRIADFINLPQESHIHKLKYFNPDLSIKNTRIYLQYPDLFSDVNKIEKELEKYCYPFPDNNQKIPVKYFLIQNVYDKVNGIQRTGKTPRDLRGYLPVLLFCMSKFYQYLHNRKGRKGRQFFKWFLKTGILLILLPFEYTGNIFLFLLSKIAVPSRRKIKLNWY
jgi:hypothetical protein